MAIHGGEIVAVGKEHEILNAFRGSEVQDLKGATVFPGLIDAHSHLLGYALNLSHTNLVGTRSWEEVIQRLTKEHSGSSSPWIRGRGWDQNDWEDSRFPDLEALDSLFPDQSVVLQRIDGHAVIANRHALEATGLFKSANIPGGEILCRGDGMPQVSSLMALRIPSSLGFLPRILRPKRQPCKKHSADLLQKG